MHRFPIAALALAAFSLGSAPRAAQQSPDPIKVFVLAGQSNMVGHGKALNGRNPAFDPSQPQSASNLSEIPGGIGGLAWAVETMPYVYGPEGTDPLVDAEGAWWVRDDVQVYARMEVFQDRERPGELTPGVTRKGAHTVGFGKADSGAQRWIGPEYGFGHVVGDALEEPVLLVKVATGGTSLKTDWRSPSAVRYRTHPHARGSARTCWRRDRCTTRRTPRRSRRRQSRLRPLRASYGVQSCPYSRRQRPYT